MEPKHYLSRYYPLALHHALKSQFQPLHINDLAHILKLTHDYGKEIPREEVQKLGKIDRGSFGSIFKATYKGQLYVMKCIGQASVQYKKLKTLALTLRFSLPFIHRVMRDLLTFGMPSIHFS